MDTATVVQDALLVLVIRLVLNALNVKVVSIHVQQLIAAAQLVQVVLVVTAVIQVILVQLVTVVLHVILVIVQDVQDVMIVIYVQQIALIVLAVVIHAMMYIVGAIGLLVFMEAAELETVTLTVSNMPSHSHSFTTSGTVESHSHIIQAIEKGAVVNVSFYTDSKNGIYSQVSVGNISGGGSSETRWLTTNSVKPSFSGATGNTDSNGSGSSFSILPPYIVKHCWERTA